MVALIGAGQPSAAGEIIQRGRPQETTHMTAAPAKSYDPAPVEDFKSITIVIDHLADLAGKTVFNTVFGSDDASEALLDQVKYFQQSGLLHDSGVRAMIDSEGSKAFVYTVNDRQTQIIVDIDLFDSVVANPEMGKGSYMEAFASFVTLATDMQRAANEAQEGSPILLFKPN